MSFIHVFRVIGFFNLSGDRVERVLGDGGVVEEGEEVVDVAVVEGVVEVGD